MSLGGGGSADFSPGAGTTYGGGGLLGGGLLGNIFNGGTGGGVDYASGADLSAAPTMTGTPYYGGGGLFGGGGNSTIQNLTKALQQMTGGNAAAPVMPAPMPMAPTPVNTAFQPVPTPSASPLAPQAGNQGGNNPQAQLLQNLILHALMSQMGGSS
jgi:hypothetical protein